MANRDGEYWDRTLETMPRDELASLQLDRLQRQLSRCYEGSQLYRSKFDAVGMTPTDIATVGDLDEFAKLPATTKAELRADQEKLPPFGSIPLAAQADWRELHPSSGTTGAPVNTIWSARDVDQITEYSARTLWQFGVRPGDVVQNSFAYGLWVAGMSAHYAAARIGAMVIPMGTNVSTQKQIDYLLHAGPTVLLCTPSYALHISEELERQGIGPDRLTLRVGAFGGEAGAENPSTRELIESRLGVQAFDYYGLAEIGPTFASECEAKSGLHFAEDQVFVECIDPVTNRAVPDGELGVLVFTHLTREATPMIRYWSNDYARLTRDVCDCGRTHLRAVGGILGRHDDLVVFKGAKFYPSQVEDVVRDIAGLSPEFRVEIEREPDGVRVKSCTVVAEWATGEVAGVSDRLRSGLRARLGVTPAVRVVGPGSMTRTAFKAVRLVDVTESVAAAP